MGSGHERRLSLATLTDSRYRKTGRAIRTLLAEYVECHGAATRIKLDRNSDLQQPASDRLAITPSTAAIASNLYPSRSDR
jgi:hypothetical protein